MVTPLGNLPHETAFANSFINGGAGRKVPSRVVSERRTAAVRRRDFDRRMRQLCVRPEERQGRTGGVLSSRARCLAPRRRVRLRHRGTGGSRGGDEAAKIPGRTRLGDSSRSARGPETEDADAADRELPADGEALQAQRRDTSFAFVLRFRVTRGTKPGRFRGALARRVRTISIPAGARGFPGAEAGCGKNALIKSEGCEACVPIFVGQTSRTRSSHTAWTPAAGPESCPTHALLIGRRRVGLPETARRA